jgi:hypothetical protein
MLQRGPGLAASHPEGLREIAVGVGVIGPQRDRLDEKALRLVEAALALQCARQHEACLRRRDAEGDGAPRGDLGFLHASLVVFGGEVVPAHAVLGVDGDDLPQARGLGVAIAHRNRGRSRVTAS